MELIHYFFAFLISLIAMFIGAVSGGVGLIIRPLLIFIGFPSLSLITTSPVAGAVGSLPALYLLLKKEKISFIQVILHAIPVFIGSIIASLLVITFFKDWVDLVFGFLLILVSISLFLLKSFGLEERKLKITIFRKIIAYFGTAIIAFLNVISGGLGILYGSLYMMVYGKTYIGSSALWRVSAYIGVLGSIIVFLLSGEIDWKLWLAMVLGLLLGSYFGTKFVFKKGEKWLRYIVIIVAFASGINLVFF